MAHQLITVPDPRLRKRCEEVKRIDRSVRALVKEMQSYVGKLGGYGFGLAAPQFGELLQIFVINCFGFEAVLINPSITKESEKYHIVQEGCLSIPGEYFLVKRPKIVKMRGLGINGEQRSVKGHDYIAQVLMHEYQHLYGILVEDIALRRIR